MFTRILIPASIAALGLIGVPAAQAHARHHHAQATSLFASPKHTAAAHTHHTRSLKTHAHRSLKGRHIHASLHHTSKVSHTTKPLSEGGTAEPNA